jgi:hypothetical protein
MCRMRAHPPAGRERDDAMRTVFANVAAMRETI